MEFLISYFKLETAKRELSLYRGTARHCWQSPGTFNNGGKKQNGPGATEAEPVEYPRKRFCS